MTYSKELTCFIETPIPEIFRTEDGSMANEMSIDDILIGPVASETTHYVPLTEGSLNKISVATETDKPLNCHSCEEKGKNSLVTNSVATETERLKNCYLCKGDHYIKNCPKRRRKGSTLQQAETIFSLEMNQINPTQPRVENAISAQIM